MIENHLDDAGDFVPEAKAEASDLGFVMQSRFI